jgi:hypothetical protein
MHFHPNILRLREQGFEDPRLILEVKTGPLVKRLGKSM